MPRPNRVCRVCGKQYRYCPSCASDSHKPRWMTMFDCEDCHTIFTVATDFNLGKIVASEAQNALNDVDLNKDFIDNIKRDLDNIFAVTDVVLEEQAPAVLDDELVVVAEETIVPNEPKKSKKSSKHLSVEEPVEEI